MATADSTTTFHGVRLDRLERRLLSRLARVPSGCWEWQGFRHRRGYAKLQFNRKTKPFSLFAHRVAYAVFCGDPGDLFVCHKCDNPPCCNPAHLFLGTHNDNYVDMVAKRRHAWGDRTNTAVVTDEMVVTIRDRVAGGESMNGVSKSLGVSRSVVRDVVTGLRWSHVPGGAPPRELRVRRDPLTAENPVVTCECGCGETFTKYDGNGRPRRYAAGHHNNHVPAPVADAIFASVAAGAMTIPALVTRRLGSAKSIQCMISKMVKSGRLVRVSRGVYAVA